MEGAYIWRDIYIKGHTQRGTQRGGGLFLVHSEVDIFNSR